MVQDILESVTVQAVLFSWNTFSFVHFETNLSLFESNEPMVRTYLWDIQSHFYSLVFEFKFITVATIIFVKHTKLSYLNLSIYLKPSLEIFTNLFGSNESMVRTYLWGTQSHFYSLVFEFKSIIIPTIIFVKHTKFIGNTYEFIGIQRIEDSNLFTRYSIPF